MNCFTNIILWNILLQAITIVKSNTQTATSLFFGSGVVTQNPVISLNCFSDYITLSKEISEAYSQDYNQCLLNAKSDREATDNEMLDKRLAVEESSKNICQRLSACDGLDTTLEVFHCHALIGENNTKEVYSISGNASEYASVLQEEYRQIDLRHEQCCKLSERKYVEATGVNYRNLQGCLEGRIKPSLTTATTMTTTTAAVNINTPITSQTKTTVLPRATEVELSTTNVNTTLETVAIANSTS